MKIKYVIVGAGISGLTMAERIANKLNQKVLVIEKRSHIAGNIYDSYNDDGILIHNYGPHTFHTDDKEVFDYLLHFTQWHDYQHRVMSFVNGRFVPMPISLETINQLYNLNLSEDDMDAFLAGKREKIDKIKTSEDVVLSQGGRDIYEKFFKYFTIKQWGVSPAELDKSVISRIPFRKNRDTRYFTDIYQGNPKYGYTKMCEKMCENKNIRLLLNTDYKDVIDDIDYETMIYTGPLDYFYDFEYGKLLYRSIHFKFETYEMDSFQPTASSRYPMDYDYTRITEFKKMTGQKHDKTTILKEYPCFGGEPYYPYPTDEWKTLAGKYRERSTREKNVIFLGRLAEHRYYDMDDVIRRALDCFRDLEKMKQ
ncbi:MAG: UDP-galactopyranose mutase [Oscillospiraceae bacterium]